MVLLWIYDGCFFRCVALLSKNRPYSLFPMNRPSSLVPKKLTLPSRLHSSFSPCSRPTIPRPLS